MKNTLALLFGTLMLSQAYASVEDVRIGVIDMQKAIQSVEEGKKAKAQLEKDFNAKKKELQTEESAIRKAGDEFKKQSMVMSEEARAKKQNELQERVMKFQEMTAKSQGDIQQKQAELTEPIVNKLKTLIQEMAKKKGYTVILEKNDTTVLYFLEKDDLTTEIIEAYNKKPKG